MSSSLIQPQDFLHKINWSCTHTQSGHMHGNHEVIHPPPLVPACLILVHLKLTDQMKALSHFLRAKSLNSVCRESTNTDNFIKKINQSKYYELLLSDLVSDEYTGYSYKRLTNVIKTIVTSSKFDCMTLCSMTDDCLAVNVIGNHGITCELTSGLSNETDIWKMILHRRYLCWVSKTRYPVIVCP